MAAILCVLLGCTVVALFLVDCHRGVEFLPPRPTGSNDREPVASEPATAPGGPELPLRFEACSGASGSTSLDGAGVRGRILDAYGAAVAGADVHLDATVNPPGAEPAPRPLAPRRPVSPRVTARDGTFVIEGQLARGAYELRIVHRDFAVGRFSVDLQEGAADLGALLLLRGGGVQGRLVDAAGNGVGGAEIRLEAVQNSPAAIAAVGRLVGHLPPPTTDPFGYYRVPHLAPGSFRIRAVASRHADASTPPFDVVDGTLTALPDLRLTPAYDLVGTVVDADRHPVAGADVAVHGTGAQAHIQRVTRTDAAGRFVLVGLPAASLRLQVTSQGWELHHQEGVDPASGLNLLVVLVRGDAVVGASGFLARSR